MMEYWAHKREGRQIVWQTLREHLRGAARRAAECLRPMGLENAAYLAALLHDAGKAAPAFQKYLAAGDHSARGQVIHSFPRSYRRHGVRTARVCYRRAPWPV